MRIDAARLLQAGSIHSLRIDELFEGRTKYAGETPQFESSLVVLLFTNRSGSNLAAQYLTGTGLVGGLVESTNYPHVAKRKGLTRLATYPDVFAAEAAAVIGAGRLFGIKASPNQLAMLMRWNILSMFSGVRLLHAVRRNVIEQAVSLSIATQTKQWTSEIQTRKAEPEFDFEDISGQIQKICVQNASAWLIAAALKADLHQIVYEELTKDPRAQVRSVLEFIGLAADDVHLARPTLRKQANETNQRFILQYQDAMKTHIQNENISSVEA